MYDNVNYRALLVSGEASLVNQVAFEATNYGLQVIRCGSTQTGGETVIVPPSGVYPYCFEDSQEQERLGRLLRMLTAMISSYGYSQINYGYIEYGNGRNTYVEDHRITVIPGIPIG